MDQKQEKRNSELKPVLVRTFSAGVHFGYLVSHQDKQVVLTNTRRIWRWVGANTLNEIASKGLDINQSKISEPAAEIILTEAIEILTVSPEAEKILLEAKWAS